MSRWFHCHTRSHAHIGEYEEPVWTIKFIHTLLDSLLFAILEVFSAHNHPQIIILSNIAEI